MEVYLDNSATTRCSKSVQDIVLRVMAEDYGNPSSLHQKGVEAERYVREAREKIAKILKVQEKEILFTSGGTESNNLAIIGGARANQRAGKHLVTTAIEHASVLAPMQYLQEQGFEVTYLPVDRNGRISLEELEHAIREDTILVSMMHVNNEIGTIEPIQEAAELVKRKNPKALFHVDAVQSFGKLPIYPNRAKIDLLSVSGHKLHGPKGVGFLYRKDKTKVKPLLFGGGQQNGMRSGTENVPAIAGLGVACEEAYRDFEQKREHLRKIQRAFVEGLGRLDGVRINSPVGFPEGTGIPGKASSTEGTSMGRAADRPNGTDIQSMASSAEAWLCAPHIVNASFEGIDRSEALLHALEEKGIYVSSGSACSSNKPGISATLQAIGVPKELLSAALRFSFCADTTLEEVEYTISALGELLPFLRKYRSH